MNEQPIPFEVMVFVCVHQRQPGERVACANPGTDATTLLEGLKQKVREQKLEGKIRICKSGCMDRCEEGPNVLVVTPSGAHSYSRVSTDDMPTLFNKIVVNQFSKPVR